MLNKFEFVTDGRLHGDHSDDTGEYQRQLETLEGVIGPIGTPVGSTPVDPAGDKCEIPPIIENSFRSDLTTEEREELDRLRPEFEPEGLLGEYHADHSDSTQGYNNRFERYISLLGIDMPTFRGPVDGTKPIDGEGRIVSPSMKAHLAEIIAEERQKLSDKA